MTMKEKLVLLFSMMLMLSFSGKAQQKLTFDLDAARKQAIQYNRMLKNS